MGTLFQPARLKLHSLQPHGKIIEKKKKEKWKGEKRKNEGNEKKI